MFNHPSFQSQTPTMEYHTPAAAFRVIDDKSAAAAFTMAPDPHTRYVHFLAQNLNNEAARWIIQGNYDAAIVDMKYALELTRMEASTKEEDRTPCGCRFCSIESYLTIADDDDDNDDNDGDNEYYMRQPEVPSRCSIDAEIKNDDFDHDPKFLQDKYPIQDEGFIYRRPLLVNHHSIDQCHYMGNNLSFIILFNIALAHHLKAIETIRFAVDANDRFNVLQQPLKLYELAYQVNFDEKNEGQETQPPQHGSQPSITTTSNNKNRQDLRLLIILTNNIGEIHKLAGNTAKHKVCLEHLLNACMYMNYTNHNFPSGVILSDSEKDGVFDNLAPILNTKVYAAAA